MEKISETLKHLPHLPGVYLFRNLNSEIIYIGKAVDLSRRVKQYFQSQTNLPEKIQHLVPQITSIETKKVASEFDAIVLEAHLIQKYQPKYNSLAKDDKSPLYIKFTLSEELPRIIYVRRQTLQTNLLKKSDRVFGPFQSGFVARSLLRALRRATGYCTQKKRDGKPCFYTHLGLCNPCPSVITKLPDESKRAQMTRLYRQHIHQLVDIFSGKSHKIRRELEIAMKKAAQREDFETARALRNQLLALETIITRHYPPEFYLSGEHPLTDILSGGLVKLFEILEPHIPQLKSVSRIECFDISALQGKSAVGSLVVLKNGLPDNREYRRFRIKTMTTPDDYRAMQEILARRLNHTEWKTPDLIVVDGGKGQLTAALSQLALARINLPTIALAKRREEIILKDSRDMFITLRLSVTSPAIHILERIRDEAHRFAVSYHRKLRGKTFLSD